jgi:addiction module HigA family antidote
MFPYEQKSSTHVPRWDAYRGIPEFHIHEQYRLAKEIRVPAQRIGEIVAGKRAITADTDLRLRRFFGLSDLW